MSVEWTPDQIAEFKRQLQANWGNVLKVMSAPAPEIPDVLGTVRAYRKWGVAKGWLTSSANASYWPGGEQVAKCDKGKGHAAPGDGCHCGLYACTDPASLELQNRSGLLGVVECYGAIIEHEKNSVIRVERAKIAAICVPRWRRAELVARNYPGVPVFRSRKAMLRAYPPADGKVKLGAYCSLRAVLRVMGAPAILVWGLYGAATHRYWLGNLIYLTGAWLATLMLFGRIFGPRMVLSLARTMEKK
jgi:hypothetical protein